MIPLIALLGFATWTMLLLIFGVGLYRWSHILTGRAEVAEWRPDDLSAGSDFYRRAMRAHANCLESLPVFGAIVLAIVVTGTEGYWVDRLSVLVMVGRVLQSLVHLSFVQTNRVVSFRFTFLCMQLGAMLAMVVMIFMHLA